MKLNWKRQLLFNKVQFFKNNKLVGRMGYHSLWKSAKIEFDDNKYEIQSFKTLFVNSGEFYASEPKRILARFKFNSLKRTGTIKSDGKEYNLKLINFWGTKWKLTDDNQSIIKLSNSCYKGNIEAETEDISLVLVSYYLSKQKHIVVYAFILIYLVFTVYQAFK